MHRSDALTREGEIASAIDRDLLDSVARAMPGRLIADPQVAGSSRASHYPRQHHRGVLAHGCARGLVENPDLIGRRAAEENEIVIDCYASNETVADATAIVVDPDVAGRVTGRIHNLSFGRADNTDGGLCVILSKDDIGAIGTAKRKQSVAPVVIGPASRR